MWGRELKLPSKCLVDTNVPITANLVKHPDQKSDIDDQSILECISAIRDMQKMNTLVLDDADIIFSQYRNNLAKSAKESYGNYGAGDAFYIWVRDNRFNFPVEDRVSVTKKDDSYVEFPASEGLEGFDPSDKIFIAVANAHKDKPPIVQGTDSKWWGYKDILETVGIKIIFLCPEYVEQKYKQKMSRP
jgi:hypothetical protein